MSLSNALSAVGVAACAYVLLLLVLFLFQSRLIYFPNIPSRALGATPEAFGLDYESLDLVTEDGLRIHGWYVPATDRRGVVLFCHGNAGNISDRLDSIRIFNRLGLDVLIFDYRGYGQSDGSPSETGTYRDGDAAWIYLTRDRGFAAEDIVVFGRSLGTGIATYLASTYKPGGLIVESGFTSVPDMAAALYPWLPARWLTRIKYPNHTYIQSVEAPILVIHGRDDEIIPYRQGRALFDAAPEPKTFLELRGGHNDGFLLTGQDYIDGLDGFLRGVFKR